MQSSVRTMRSKAFTGLGLISLLLFAGTIALWVESYFYSRSIHYRRPTGLTYLIGDVGRIALSWDDRSISEPNTWAVERNPSGGAILITHTDLFLDSHRWGFGYAWARPIHAGKILTTYVVMAPHWFVALLFAFVPVLWTVIWWRFTYRPRTLGLCPNCGYDLRESRDRCPECGEIVVSTATHNQRHQTDAPRR
jgi:hypothetical protein